MNWTLSLLLAMAGTAATPPANLAFETGRLTNWEGDGFSITPEKGEGPHREFAASSSDSGKPGRTAILHRTFTLPTDACFLRFSAAAFRPENCQGTPDLDVVLEAPGRVFIPRQVLTSNGWKPSTELLSAGADRQLKEYRWDVSGYAGRTVRIAAIDRDERPDCYLVCAGFRIVPREDSAERAFAAEMLKLTREHKLGAMERYDSKHFMSITNAVDDYTRDRLTNCETIYALFFEHFRGKGFSVREPAEKMMVAVFDTEEGFEACLGTRMPTSITGIYHRGTNRLVVYDYASNRTQQAIKRAGEQEAKKIEGGLTRQRVLGSITRQARERRDDANVATIMHEVSHQLSFNCGLLNREADVACWLAEGLATYCESTVDGTWQGIGEPNPMRASTLAGALRGQVELYSLSDLVSSDDWIRHAKTTEAILIGYAQSWSLFRFLMEERPQQLRKYLSLINQRRTADHRVADFIECFGDLGKLETSYRAYIQQIAAEQSRTRRR